MCSFDKLVALLKGRVEFCTPIPACPRHASVMCAKDAGKCEVGNNRECTQWLTLFIGRSPFTVLVKFVYTPDSRTGFFSSTDTAIRRMIIKGVLTAGDLEGMRIG